jgi:protein-L-isoaspartate O-methyltransferase
MIDGPAVGSGDRRKESFDEVADAYDAYRTPPPPDVVDAVVAAAELRQGSRVLEIGCGAGQLSVPLAARRVDLLAVELGSHLAAHARRRLEPYLNARVVVSAFEDWELPTEPFDAVVCANAFHWLDPDVRFAKCSEALRPAGSLVIIHMHHVRGGTAGFFAETQPYYVKWGLSDDPFFEPTAPADIPTMYPELDRVPEFGPVTRHRIELPMSYSTSSYTGWLSTDSLVNSLDAEARRGFLQDIEHLIDANYDGGVVRNFVYDIIAATRRA